MKSTKIDWRRRLLAERAAIPEGVRTAHAVAIADRVRQLGRFESPCTVLGYVALGAEVDPASLMASLAHRGSVIRTPLSGMEGPMWVRWHSGSTPETLDSEGMASEALPRPIVAIVPGVGFDERGARLGRGRGFYDRVLADLRRRGSVYAVGLAFEKQVVAELPVDPWDARMDVVVTEARVIDPTGSGRQRKEASAT